MSRFVEGCDRRQPTLLSECLDDDVTEENPERLRDQMRWLQAMEAKVAASPDG